MPCTTCGRYHEADEPCGSSISKYFQACQEALDALADVETEDAWGWLAWDRQWLDAASEHWRRASAARARYQQALWAAERAL